MIPGEFEVRDMLNPQILDLKLSSSHFGPEPEVVDQSPSVIETIENQREPSRPGLNFCSGCLQDNAE